MRQHVSCHGAFGQRLAGHDARVKVWRYARALVFVLRQRYNRFGRRKCADALQKQQRGVEVAFRSGGIRTEPTWKAARLDDGVRRDLRQ